MFWNLPANKMKTIRPVTGFLDGGVVTAGAVFGGDFEMEALAAGAVRALRGEEPLKTYTGEPAWSGFPYAPRGNE